MERVPVSVERSYTETHDVLRRKSYSWNPAVLLQSQERRDSSCRTWSLFSLFSLFTARRGAVCLGRCVVTSPVSALIAVELSGCCAEQRHKSAITQHRRFSQLL